MSLFREIRPIEIPEPCFHDGRATVFFAAYYGPGLDAWVARIRCVGDCCMNLGSETGLAHIKGALEPERVPEVASDWLDRSEGMYVVDMSASQHPGNKIVPAASFVLAKVGVLAEIF